MLDKLTNEPNVQDAAVQPRDKKSASRSSLKSEEQKIVAFLKECEPCQADAIRAIAICADDPKKPFAISEHDAVYINRYLHAGADASRIKSLEDMMLYRRERMNKLLTSSNRFCEHDELQRVMIAVVNIAIDPATVRTSFEYLKKSVANS
jgi:hypothetical protein